jgi:hypothetical protein
MLRLSAETIARACAGGHEMGDSTLTPRQEKSGDEV